MSLKVEWKMKRLKQAVLAGLGFSIMPLIGEERA
jgi:hypothetical protein